LFRCFVYELRRSSQQRQPRDLGHRTAIANAGIVPAKPLDHHECLMRIDAVKGEDATAEKVRSHVLTRR
jgi:hypothetical protein